jgi:hypothetical protein
MQVFDGVIGVLDGQLWVATNADDIGPDMDASFSGQQNGLLGAAEAGVLRLITGTADGDVRLSVQVVEREPQLDDSWEDCVEVTFSPASPVVALFDWDGAASFEIPLGEASYRVRYATRGADAGNAGTETEVAGLWFWPAPPGADAIIRQTSKSAAYWHSHASRLRQLGL